MSSELAAPASRTTTPGHTGPALAQPAPPTQEEHSVGADTGADDTSDEAASGTSSETNIDFSSGGSAGPSSGTGITCRLEELLAERAMTMTELSRRTGITMANLSIMKNNKAKAIRMTTIAALCRALRVTPGQLLVLNGDTT